MLPRQRKFLPLFALNLLILDSYTSPHVFLYEHPGGRDAEGVACSPQEAHPVGNPISQRENRGFNWTPLAVTEQEPPPAFPEARKRCCAPSTVSTIAGRSRVCLFFLPTTSLAVEHVARLVS